MTIFDWLKQYGIEIEDHTLIDEAFTHSSYVNEHKQVKHHNERLEFMGDAVMQIWVSERLFYLDPPVPEGKMTNMRQQLVCEATFAAVMRQWDLGRFIRLGAGEEKNGGRNRSSLLADAFEAFIGALYLSNGMEAVDRILEPTFKTLIIHPEVTGIVDYKTRLQEYAQSDVRKSVTYKVLAESGPSNSPTFEIGVYLDNILLGKGEGSNKKAAEQAAAKQALDLLVK